MNGNRAAKHYGSLTPEERFRLILAASGRGDEAERERLRLAGGQITLSVSDHCPHAHAFDELALQAYLELLEVAARYTDALARAAGPGCRDEDGEAEEAQSPAEGGRGARPVSEEALDQVLAWGFWLRTMADGGKLFCERLSVPPFLLWEGLPGFGRLRRALAAAEKAAFVPEGYLRWWNAVRPAGEPEQTEVPLTVEGVADATAQAFRCCVEWWGG